MNGLQTPGLLDSCASSALISASCSQRIGDLRRIHSGNKRFQACNGSAVHISYLAVVNSKVGSPSKYFTVALLTD